MRVQIAPVSGPVTPNRACAASADRQSAMTARDPMCFSSHTTSATPRSRKWAKASSGRSSHPSSALLSQGDIVGGR